MAGRLLRAAAVVALAFIAMPLQAATYTWNVTTGTWTTTTDWSPTAPAGGPTSTDSIVFQGASNITVDYGGASRTVANISNSGTGITLPLTITATNGSLTINGGDQAFGASANGSLTNDYSGLSAFTYTESSANRTFSVRMTTAAGYTSGTATLNLAMQGSGTNLIRATTTIIGQATNSNGTAWGGALGLGKANTLNTNTLTIGGFNGTGAVRFQDGVTNGTLVVRGTGGGSTRAGTITVGETSSGLRDGSGVLDLTGGTIDLSGTNLLIGRHVAASNTPSGSGTVTMPGGTVDVVTMVLGEKNSSGNPAITGAFTQSGGSVTSGTVRFGNILNTGTTTTAPTFTSTYTLSSGTLRAGLITTEPSVAITATTTANAASVRRIAWSGGTIANYDATTDLTISGTSTNAGYTMQLVLGSTTTPQVFSADSSRTITISSSAVISGTGFLQKQGAGTLRINTAATYTGSTSIAAGTIQLGVANALPSATALAINPSAGTATLDLNGFDQTVGSLASSGAGAAVVDVAATGTSRLTVGGDNTSTTFAGRLRNSGGATSVLGFTKNGTGTWTLTGSNSAVAGNLVFNNGKVTIDPGAAGSFTSTGRFQVLPGSGVTATVEILSGSNSFATSAGIGGLADNSASGTAVWNLAGGTTTLALSTNRFLIGNKGTGTVTVSNNAAFTITGAPDLVIGGDQSFAANNATGVVTVSSGTLSITGSGSLVLGRNATTPTTGANGTVNLDGGVFATIRPFTVGTGTGTINFNGGTVRALSNMSDFIAVTTANVKNGGAIIDTNSFNVTIAQGLLNGGAGGLSKQGSGTLTLTAANTYVGATTVNAGVLAVNGSLGAGGVTVNSGAVLGGSGTMGGLVTIAGGTLSPGGTPGIMTMDSLALDAAATTVMEISGTAPGTGYDQVVLTGTLGYEGTLSLNLQQAFADGVVFDLFKGFSSSSGNFASVQSVGSAYPGVTFTRANAVWTSTTVNNQYLRLDQATGDLAIVVVPEPSTLALAATAVAFAGVAVRRRAGRGRRWPGSSTTLDRS